MKKHILFYTLLLSLLSAAWAEKGAVLLGLGIEGNMNTNEGGALGRSISVDFQFFDLILTGAVLTISDDFKRFTAIEPEIFARWYLPFLQIKDGGLFIQGDLGISIAIGFTANVTPRLLAGLTAGYRYPFDNGLYYIEPFLKSGYPFLVGGGARLGCRF
jgi:hypothetical protein